MTTIAYSAKHKMIAADMQATAGDVRVGVAKKVWRIGSLFFAGAGCSTYIQSFHDWITKGMPGKHPYMGDIVDVNAPGAIGIIFLDGGLAITFDAVGVERVFAPYHTYGSGKDFARTALEMGATPEQAVREAMKHDVYSGIGVHSIQLPDTERFDFDGLQAVQWAELGPAFQTLHEGQQGRT